MQIHTVKINRVVEFSAVATSAAYTRLMSGQRTNKEWRNAVDQVITFRGFGTTL
jgi:hypothetical protein